MMGGLGSPYVNSALGGVSREMTGSAHKCGAIMVVRPVVTQTDVRSFMRDGDFIPFQFYWIFLAGFRATPRLDSNTPSKSFTPPLAVEPERSLEVGRARGGSSLSLTVEIRPSASSLGPNSRVPVSISRPG